jgi:hypothetical protein
MVSRSRHWSATSAEAPWLIDRRGGLLNHRPQSQGPEFDQVRLAEDFPSLLHTPQVELNLEEVNLLYVAITARWEAELNTPVRELIEVWSRASDMPPETERLGETDVRAMSNA